MRSGSGRVVVGAGVLAAALGALCGVARAGNERDPVSQFGLRLAEDFVFKWRGVIPEVGAFQPGEAPEGWGLWGRAGADASIPARSGRVSLGLGVGRLGLRVDTTAIVEGSATRLRIHLALGAGVGRLVLRLPDVKVTPRFDKGQLTFDYMVPIIEHRF